MNPIRFDPNNEVGYRRRLAEGFLRDAQNSYMNRDWRNTVLNSQLAVENAAKAIIAIFRVPSWTHDPSPELEDILDRIPRDLRDQARRLAEISHILAPEHSRATYGDIIRGIPPWDLYSEGDAIRVLNLAREAINIMRNLLRQLHHD